MKIAILHPHYADSTLPFVPYDSQCDLAPFLGEHEFENFQIQKTTAVRQVAGIVRSGFDVIINLCDGSWEDDAPGIEVVQALERMNAAFTGAGSAFYDPTREAMKMACHSVGVRFPAYVMAREIDDAERALRDLRFPMLVKHPNGHSSLGISPNSRVTTALTLRAEVARTIDEFGAALIEEFIEGVEYSVLVTEPRDVNEEAWALPPVEFLFPEGETFKHFNLKWKAKIGMRMVADGELAERLREVSALTFAALGGTGYGRCDLRVDAAGEIYLLEISPNCAVFYPEADFDGADFSLANDPAGHRGFVEHLLRCALRRRNRAIRPWEIRHRRDHGFGMFARHTIAEGEVAVRYEEESHVLASRHQVERNWRGMKRRWFEQYAWPLTSELHVLWSDKPEDWRPLNHSCNPNTWLEGLDLVARRVIRPDEELSADYATFCGPAMASFECRCGAPECRRVITGSDHLLPEIRERYGEHVSEFVRLAWNNTAPGWRPPWEIVQNTFGLGLVARRAWKAGDTVSPLTWAKRSSSPSKWTVQCGAEEHAEPQPFELRYVNHSCKPNVSFEVDAGELRALRDIEPGDELRFFYPATEWEMADVFHCQCGEVGCLGSISGASAMPEGVLARYTVSSVIRGKLAARVLA
ncbi:MAG: SET domain-containing protein-lysine N-methyltransferase [Acidobacteria bacterium]|nr:SET domain-containing protein-lysine N-methyltransferase [Acidobacteriota bacterium]